MTPAHETQLSSAWRLAHIIMHDILITAPTAVLMVSVLKCHAADLHIRTNITSAQSLLRRKLALRVRRYNGDACKAVQPHASQDGSTRMKVAFPNARVGCSRAALSTEFGQVLVDPGSSSIDSGQSG